MVFVQRDGGKIVGIYALKQDGYAEEEIADDDSEVLEFLNPTPMHLVPKRVIVDRLQAAGLLAKARAALDAQDLYTRERWNSRDSILANDPTTIALLTAIGADVQAILAE